MLYSFIARCVARCIVFRPGMFGVSLKEGFSSGTAGRTVFWGEKMKGSI